MVISFTMCKSVADLVGWKVLKLLKPDGVGILLLLWFWLCLVLFSEFLLPFFTDTKYIDLVHCNWTTLNCPPMPLQVTWRHDRHLIKSSVKNSCQEKWIFCALQQSWVKKIKMNLKEIRNIAFNVMNGFFISCHNVCLPVQMLSHICKGISWASMYNHNKYGFFSISIILKIK